jgi:hypothetical protein
MLLRKSNPSGSHDILTSNGVQDCTRRSAEGNVFRSCLGRMVEDVMMCVERLPNALEVFRTNFRVIIFRKAKVQFRADDMEHLTGVTRSLKF